MFENKENISIQKAIFVASNLLRKKGLSNNRLESELLLTKLLKCKRIDLYANLYDLLDKNQILNFSYFVQRRLQYEPIAYILGTKEFMGLEFFVNSNVLIPRADTEIIVENVLSDFSNKKDSLAILDLCSGSGCIGLSLLNYLKHARVFAVDICDKALMVSWKNAKTHGLTKRYAQSQGDILSESFWQTKSCHYYDSIVANPPYINPKDQELVIEETKLFEPPKALYAPSKGLLFYKVLAENAYKLLKPKGKIYIEIPPDKCENIRLFFQNKQWILKKTAVDYSNKTRVLCYEKAFIL